MPKNINSMGEKIELTYTEASFSQVGFPSLYIITECSH